MLQSAVMSALIATQQQQQQPSSPVEQDMCAQLVAMGFTDMHMNLRALRACAGNLELAIGMLVAQRETMMELD